MEALGAFAFCQQNKILGATHFHSFDKFIVNMLFRVAFPTQKPYLTRPDEVSISVLTFEGGKMHRIGVLSPAKAALTLWFEHLLAYITHAG